MPPQLPEKLCSDDACVRMRRTLLRKRFMDALEVLGLEGKAWNKMVEMKDQLKADLAEEGEVIKEKGEIEEE
jgi:hypothetical protein